VAQGFGVGLPTAVAQLLVDDGAGRGLVEINGARGLLDLLLLLRLLLRRGLRSRVLQGE